MLINIIDWRNIFKQAWDSSDIICLKTSSDIDHFYVKTLHFITFRKIKFSKTEQIKKFVVSVHKRYNFSIAQLYEYTNNIMFYIRIEI